MFNFTSAAITSASVFENGCYNAQNHLSAVYNETVQPIVVDCLNDCGFPPLQEAIDFFRSENGKRFVANVFTFVRTAVLIVAFLSLASVMGIAMVSQKIGSWAWGLFINKFAHALHEHQMFELFVIPANRAFRAARAMVYLTKRELRRLWREAMAEAAKAARRAVASLDAASGVIEPTF